jgi:hypothetical protein
MGFEYRSAVTVGSWPLLHICAGIDPATMRPRVAKGVIAIGNIAVGVFALGGLSFGLITAGGVSLGLLLALGGVAAGVGLSLGGVAVGAAAFGASPSVISTRSVVPRSVQRSLTADTVIPRHSSFCGGGSAS